MPEVEKAGKKDVAEKKEEKLKKLEEKEPESRLEEEKPEDKKEVQPAKEGFKFKLAIPPIVKNILILSALFIVLILAAFLLTSKVMKPFMKAQIQASAKQKKETVAKKKTAKKTATASEVTEVFLVSDMIVNPAETNGTRFLNTTIGLGVTDKLVKVTLEEKSAQVRDALISILTTKTIPELVHPDGKKILRREIIRKVDSMITPYHILEVYFVDFVLQ